MNSKLTLLVLLFATQLFSQKNDFSSLTVASNLYENANSIILNQEISITIHSQKSYSIKKQLTVKVLNEKGLKNVDAVEYHNKSTRIKQIDAKMYNDFGKQLKDFKQKDFKDQSVADGISILTENRMIYLDYTPTEYPFTIVYTSELESENTAFIPSWTPINDFYESALKTSISITYPTDLGFKYKELNLGGLGIAKKEDFNKITFQGENIVAIKYEDYSPSFQKTIPKVLFGLEKFNLEGIEGSAKSWKDFGLWMNNSLLKQKEEISEETKQKLKTLIGSETDPVKKSQIVYQFLQDKTRYVSIQLGIGGWKPMLVKDVDRLGYGDCKALSNYTKSLLDFVGVPTYYTIIYAGEEQNNLQEDFVSMQGNHAVLSIPTKEKLVFLECTSQTAPFGFEGNFTDDRFALIVKPDGGEIVKTNSYIDKDNIQKSKSNYSITEKGELNGLIEVKSKGIAYNNSYFIESESKENIIDYYKEALSQLQNLKIQKFSFINNKEAIEFTEKIECTATNYASINGATMVFPLNAFNQYSNVPKRYRTRNNPLEIPRGFYDEDEIQITIPDNFSVDAIPNNFSINDKFGEYKTEVTIVNPTTLLYKRSLLIKKGSYDKSEYDNFRKFTEKIAKADNSKLLLTKKS